MEKWDLYNAKREKSGITVCRGEIIPKGLYHLSVSVWIVNQQGQYLLSQRHPKKQYPLYWECTGGSVLSGETSLQGAIREVKEELGILLTPGSEKLIYQSRRENVQDFYVVDFRPSVFLAFYKPCSPRYDYEDGKQWVCKSLHGSCGR